MITVRPLRVCVFVLLLLSSACESLPPSQAAAEQFLDAHYVRMDLNRSHELADSLARVKIAKEMELVAELQGEERPKLPHVHYSQELSRPGDQPDLHTYQYRLRIQAGAVGDALEKLVLLTLRKGEDGEWGVSNFSDGDVPKLSIEP